MANKRRSPCYHQDPCLLNGCFVDDTGELLIKHVRNVWSLGYIQVWRDEPKQENGYKFDTGVPISEIPYRIFRFLWDGTFLEDVLHFTSLQLQLMHGTMLYTLIIFVGRTLHLFCRKETKLIRQQTTTNDNKRLTNRRNINPKY